MVNLEPEKHALSADDGVASPSANLPASDYLSLNLVGPVEVENLKGTIKTKYIHPQDFIAALERHKPEAVVMHPFKPFFIYYGFTDRSGNVHEYFLGKPLTVADLQAFPKVEDLTQPVLTAPEQIQILEKGLMLNGSSVISGYIKGLAASGAVYQIFLANGDENERHEISFDAWFRTVRQYQDRSPELQYFEREQGSTAISLKSGSNNFVTALDNQKFRTVAGVAKMLGLTPIKADQEAEWVVDLQIY